MARLITTEYVARLINHPYKGMFLEHVSEGWGPKRLPTKKLIDAERFEEFSLKYMAQEILRSGWEFEWMPVRVTLTVVEIKD